MTGICNFQVRHSVEQNGDVSPENHHCVYPQPPVQCTYLSVTFIIVIIIPFALGFPSYHFHSGFQNKILHVFLFSHAYYVSRLYKSANNVWRGDKQGKYDQYFPSLQPL